MKVSEAKKKICPFISAGDKYYKVIGDQKLKAPTCICSDCMAWAFTKQKSDTKFDLVALKIDDGTTITQRRGIGLEEDDKEGYCKKLNL